MLKVLFRWRLGRSSMLAGTAFLIGGGALVSLPAAAVCPPCTAMPFVTAQNTAVTTALTLMNQAIVTALGLHGGGTAANKQGNSAATFDAEKSEAAMENAGESVVEQRRANMEMVTNNQSLNCRMHTMDNVSRAITQKFQQAVAFNLQDGVINLFFNRSFTPDRTLVASLQRNCKNGQLRRTDMGDGWWNAINAASAPTSQCFEDATDVDGDGVPDFAHGFMRPSTILDYRVLIPPSNAQMDVLNNPESAALGGPQAVWGTLTPKQRAYVSAVRFCENIALTALKPLDVYGDEALDVRNMSTALTNMAAIAKLDALVYACRSELARRTAPDAAAMVGAGFNDMTELVNNNPRVGEILIRSGVNPQEFREGGTDYMSAAMLAYGRGEAFCSSMATSKSMYADSGTDDQKTQNILRCEQLKLYYKETEDIYRSLFSNMVNGVSRLEGQFSSGIRSPTRTEADGMVQKASFSDLRKPWSVGKKLVDMIKE